MKLILHIAVFKFRSLLKILFQWSVPAVVKNITSVLVFGAFAYSAYYFTRTSVDYLLDTAKLGSFLLHRFLSMILFVYFLSINVGNMIVSYATLYRSSEVQYYLTKPISHGQFFILKFFDNFFYSSTAFFLIAIAVVLGYGSHFNVHWTYYIQVMVFMLIPFMLIAGCLAVIFLLLIMQFSAYISAKKIIIILLLLYIVSLYVYFSLTSPLKLVAAVLQHYPQLDQYFGYLDPPVTKYLPNYWIAESLYWHMQGNASYAASFNVLLLIATIFIFSLMMVIGKSFFYRSWNTSLNMQNRTSLFFQHLRWFSLTKPPLLPPQVSVLLRKEIAQFIREPSQWIHLAIISLLTLTFLASISHIDLKQNMPFLQTVSYMVVLLFNAFLVASIALRFVFPSISVEGPEFWSVLSAPVRRKKILFMKFSLWFIPVVILSELLVIFSHMSLMAYPSLVIVASLIMLGTAYALVGLNLGAGGYFSDYKERNPIRVASSQSATITFLLSIVYLTIMVSLTFVPLNGFFSFILRNVPFDAGFLYAATALFLALSVVIGSGGALVAMKSLSRDFS